MSEEPRIPVIRLWNRLLVPLQGEITDSQAARLTNDVLQMIAESHAAGLVLDLTGVWVMDSHLCAALSRLARAADLMGSRTVMSGLRPEIAMTLQMMGIELGDLRTTLTLEDALEHLGLRAEAEDGDGAGLAGLGGDDA